MKPDKPKSEMLSPACISSWLNLQYKAVILSVCNILSSFPTTDKHGICTVYIKPHTAARVMNIPPYQSSCFSKIRQQIQYIK